MVKIVIFVAIVTLACVNAQRSFAFAGFPPSGLFGIFKHMNLMTPEEMIRQQNIKVTSPEELMNKQPRPNEQFVASYVKSERTADGKTLTSMVHNNNGEKKGYTWTT